MCLKKISVISVLTLAVLIYPGGTKATEECFEGVSRTMFKFNMAFDDVILEPVAKGYNKLPNFIRVGTSNFTSNISTLLSIPNNLLQGNFNQLGQSVGSFLIKPTVSVIKNGRFSMTIFLTVVSSVANNLSSAKTSDFEIKFISVDFPTFV